MKKYKHFIFTIMLFLICITNAYAACTKEEINEFKKVEDEYTIKYEFNKETKDYTLYFNAPMLDTYSYSSDDHDPAWEFKDMTDTSYSLTGVAPGNYKFEVIIMSNTCTTVFKTITLNLGKYNEYSTDPLCDGIEEFVLCQETYDKDIDYDTFVSRVNTYKKSKKTNVEEKPIEKEENNQVLEYIKNNLFQIIIVTIFIVLVLITAYVTITSMRKSRRLE